MFNQWDAAKCTLALVPMLVHTRPPPSIKLAPEVGPSWLDGAGQPECQDKEIKKQNSIGPSAKCCESICQPPTINGPLHGADSNDARPNAW